MSGKKGKSRLGKKDAEERKKHEKTSKEKADFASAMMGRIGKTASHKKREELKEKMKEKQPTDFSLPPREYEEATKEALEPEDEGDNPFDAGNVPTPKEGAPEATVEPVNPFEPPSAPSPTIKKKALEDKPLDRRKDEVEKSASEGIKEEKAPEDVGQSREEVSIEKEKRGRTETESETEEGELKVEEKPEEGVAEVVEVKGEPIPGHVESAEVAETASDKSDVREFKEEFWGVLEQAGFTKKRLKSCLVFLIIGLLVLFFFWFKWYKIFGFGGDDGVEREEEVVEKQAFGIVTSYILGLEYTETVTPIEAVPIGEWDSFAGIDSALIFGGIEIPFEAKIIYYADVLRRMDNMYYTDIYSLIDMSVDRRAALNRYLEEMAALIGEADGVYNEIRQALTNFDKEYEGIAAERDLYEEQFFAFIEALYGQDSYNSLESFVALSQEAARIKAYYNAYKILGELYITYLDALEPRYQDILANTEALIKGIRVFDIPASDIEAIIPVSEE